MSNVSVESKPAERVERGVELPDEEGVRIGLLASEDEMDGDRERNDQEGGENRCIVELEDCSVFSAELRMDIETPGTCLRRSKCICGRY